MEEHYQFFQKLKAHREQKEITLEEISEKTKIRVSYLKAIENGDIEKIPSVYDKLFFQSYLDSIRIEKPDYYLEIFQEIRNAVRTKDATTLTTMRTVNSDDNSFVRKRMILFGIPVILTVIIILIFAVNSKKVETSQAEEVQEVPAMKLVQKLEEQERKQRDSLAAAQAKAAGNRQVTAAFKALDITWLRYVKDRGDTSEILMQVADSVSVDADSILEFLIGKANGLEFTVNGKHEGILGNPGEIITNLTITEDGIVQKQIKEKSNVSTTDDTTNLN